MNSIFLRIGKAGKQQPSFLRRTRELCLAWTSCEDRGSLPMSNNSEVSVFGSVDRRRHRLPHCSFEACTRPSNRTKNARAIFRICPQAELGEHVRWQALTDTTIPIPKKQGLIEQIVHYDRTITMLSAHWSLLGIAAKLGLFPS